MVSLAALAFAESMPINEGRTNVDAVAPQINRRRENIMLSLPRIQVT